MFKRNPDKKIKKIEAKVKTLETQIQTQAKIQSHILDLIIKFDKMIDDWKEELR